MVSNNEIEIFKKFDYFAGDESSYKKKVSNFETVLYQGKHWDTPPLVTIIIPTYKRVDTLRYALESALYQENFDDYQVIVADNEAAPICEETGTSKFMKKYTDNDKVIYYRHVEEVIHREDCAASLAKSRWIVFLHDDDVLVKNYLRTVMDIVSEKKNIYYLGVEHSSFYDEPTGETMSKLMKPVAGKYEINKYDVGAYEDMSAIAYWQGALIDREKYYEIDGMPNLICGSGDYMMMGRFYIRFGLYRINAPLYKYRVWNSSDSAKREGHWLKAYISQYYFDKQLIQQSNFKFKKLGQKVLIYNMLEKIEAMQRAGHEEVKMDVWKNGCNIKENISIKSTDYKIIMFINKVRVSLYSRLHNAGECWEIK